VQHDYADLPDDPQVLPPGRYSAFAPVPDEHYAGHPGLPVDSDGADRRAAGAHLPRIAAQTDLHRAQSDPGDRVREASPRPAFNLLMSVIWMEKTFRTG